VCQKNKLKCFLLHIVLSLYTNLLIVEVPDTHLSRIEHYFPNGTTQVNRKDSYRDDPVVSLRR